MKRTQALMLYGARACLSRSVSRKFITGDGFVSMCEASIVDLADLESDRKINTLTSAKSIFIKGDIYDHVIALIGDSMSAKKVLVGNSDRDFDDASLNLPRNASQIYFQNLQFPATDRVGLLPIGIENLSLARNALPFVFGRVNTNKIKSKYLLIGPFSPTFPERQELLNLDIHLIPNSDLYLSLMSPARYFSEAGKYRFIAAPRGNGVDTHRFWEALYMNSIPIVRDSPWARNIQLVGFPCVVVNEWTIECILEAISKFDYLSVGEEYREKLKPSYWNSLFNSV